MAEVKRVCAAFFSATGTTKKVVTRMAETAADRLHCPHQVFDFTLPQDRRQPLRFDEADLVVFGVPVYAGRVPNVLLKFLDTLAGSGAAAIPAVLFGNRNYDDALIELRDILHRTGFYPFAAAAFVGEHAFSTALAAGRPDRADMAAAEEFARSAADNISRVEGIPALIAVSGTPAPYRGYYQPRDAQGHPVDIRRVKPRTAAACDNCKACAALCPMGSVSFEDVREVAGICIKCGACVKRCPRQAKHFADADYLYHLRELEQRYARRAEPECFL